MLSPPLSVPSQAAALAEKVGLGLFWWHKHVDFIGSLSALGLEEDALKEGQ